MNVSSIKKKVSNSVRYIKRNNPYSLERETDGIKLKKEDTSFNPKKEDHKDRVFLVIIDGMDTKVKEVEKYGDDMVLEYEDKMCAITSKPLLIEGNQMYFTKDGFLGTMALNKDTLIAGDIYNPSMDEKYERRISKDVDVSKIPFDLENRAEDEDEDYYYIKNEEMEDVVALHGSKKTLKEVNKAKRLRKLLQPSKMDKKKLLMAVGSGIAIGFYLYPQIQG